MTVTESALPGFVTVFPCGTTQPNASNVNFTAGATVANAVLVKVGKAYLDVAAGVIKNESGEGKVCLFTSVDTHLIVDAAGPADDGFVTVYPCDGPKPATSSLNYSGGATVANAVITKVSAVGTVCLFTSQSTDLIADVTGEFS